MTAGHTRLGAALRAHGSRFGTFLLSVDRTGSTNTLARELAQSGAPCGSIVLAEEQACGRGRWSRSWASASGGIYLSVVLRQTRAMRPELLPLSAAVAVAEALHSSHGIAPRIRWPNDVFASGRKLGGVLCESSFQGDRFDFAVIGIGVNLDQSLEDFPADLKGRATSVRALTGRELDPVDTAVAILRSLERRLFGAATSDTLERFRELAEGLCGARVRVVSREGEAIEATSDGLAEDGALRVRLADGTSRPVYSEDVLLLRLAEEPIP